jgi:hypothetical protein
MASTAINSTQEPMATPTLKKETTIDKRKMTGSVRPRMRKNCTVLESEVSSTKRDPLVTYQ